MISKKFLIILLAVVIVITLSAGVYTVFIKTASHQSPQNIPPEQSIQESGQSQQTTTSSPKPSTQHAVPTPITESLKPNDFTGCINNGGKDITPDFNAPQKCILDNKIYESACVSNDKYFVVEEGLTDSVGSDILVKYKSTKDQKYSCEYLSSNSDFQIKNEWAEYVFALENNFLILDSGTGPPPRGLIIYDLTTRRKVFTDSYSEPTVVSSSSITYWSPVDTKPNETNCPKIAEYTSEGLGAEIEAHVVLTLSTLSKTELGEYRCSATQ